VRSAFLRAANNVAPDHSDRGAPVHTGVSAFLKFRGGGQSLPPSSHFVPSFSPSSLLPSSLHVSFLFLFVPSLVPSSSPPFSFAPSTFLIYFFHLSLDQLGGVWFRSEAAAADAFRVF